MSSGPAGRALPGFSLRVQRGQAMLSVSAPLSAVLWRAAQNLPATAPLAVLAVALMGRRKAGPPPLKEALLAGIRRGEFSAHYQPVCETDSGRCGGAEVLMRWTTADGRAVSPEVFIAAAEREGVIIPLTRHLFTLIEKDTAAWAVPAGFRLAVNIAGSHLLHPDFLTDADALMAGLKARGITGVIEITERSLVAETRRAAAVLTRLRAAGAVVMLDDFGTGYSALSYLQTLPVDGIKIDKRFIDDLSSPDAGAGRHYRPGPAAGPGDGRRGGERGRAAARAVPAGGAAVAGSVRPADGGRGARLAAAAQKRLPAAGSGTENGAGRTELPGGEPGGERLPAPHGNARGRAARRNYQ